MTTEPLLAVEDLQVNFETEEGTVKALEGVTFELYEGDTLGIIGESGCGKTVTSRTILKLLDRRAVIAGGSIRYDGRELTELSDREMTDVRGSEIAMIFQEPMASLNPVFTVKRQLIETLETNADLAGEAALDRAVDLLDSVRIPAPRSVLEQYPHQLSGGMQQRVMIALALACEPRVLIADEPTTALDVTVQAQIMELLDDLKAEFGTSIILITHDLGVVAQTCNRVNVMYAGSVVETGTMDRIFKSPNHPYTRRLMRSIPTLGNANRKLPTIRGVVPDLVDPPSGCRFRTRCGYVINPESVTISDEEWNHAVQLLFSLQNQDANRTPTEYVEAMDTTASHEGLSTAVDAVRDGEYARATDALERLVDQSPCAGSRPEIHDSDGSKVRCHLYEYEADRRPESISEAVVQGEERVMRGDGR